MELGMTTKSAKVHFAVGGFQHEGLGFLVAESAVAAFLIQKTDFSDRGSITPQHDISGPWHEAHAVNACIGMVRIGTLIWWKCAGDGSGAILVQHGAPLMTQDQDFPGLRSAQAHATDGLALYESLENPRM
jgi:hypothetical protein